jgi:small subunit ribosomal protein S26e
MLKMYYCVSCAIHARIVAVRSAVDRRKRDTGKKKFAARQQAPKKPEEAKKEAPKA